MKTSSTVIGVQYLRGLAAILVVIGRAAAIMAFPEYFGRSPGTCRRRDPPDGALRFGAGAPRARCRPGPARDLRRFRRPGSRDQAQAVELFDRGEELRQIARRLRRARQGQQQLNYCGIRTDFLDYTVDRNPYKHGKYLPGTHIPIFSPEKIAETKPDYVLILPWNLKDEITSQLAHIRDWGASFVVPIPEVSVI